MTNAAMMREKMFQQLVSIQKLATLRAKSNLEKNNDIDSVFNELTYETIYYVMEMIDGYSSEEIKIDLVVRGTNESLRKGCELHDLCEKYLKTE